MKHLTSIAQQKHVGRDVISVKKGQAKNLHINVHKDIAVNESYRNTTLSVVA